MSASVSTRPGGRPRPWIQPHLVLAALTIGLLLLFVLLPMAWMISTSFKSQVAAMQQPPRWIPEVPTFENYAKLLDPRGEGGRWFLRYLLNSFIVSTATTVLGTAVAVPAAYAFSRFRFPGRRLLFMTILVRNMFPAVVFLIPLFILMRTFGLVDRHASLIITYMTFGLPLAIWLLKGYYDNIPTELEEAALVDGATRFFAFVRVVMPLSVPGIVAAAIYVFIQAWNEYLYALTFLNSDELMTLPVGLQSYFSEFVTDWPGLMASSFVMSIPVVVLFMVLQRYFVRALTEGALKT
ncbi:carbohydrate ABC transporter permease [Thermomicrobiaceae bacterium CFH 74404]|uniref:Carbohydrate ABC transporter permease n=1 Tax=Thermalbibacter longus TaxID=2951981 RepID=A0AA42B9P9_9BACT|nr:carbohydrate ABC transporter permease [Thermalbibacter longus]MCM8748936.1 carbohydrate ABC transporter permease [Thermalbibacter longus]